MGKNTNKFTATTCQVILWIYYFQNIQGVLLDTLVFVPKMYNKFSVNTL